MDDSEKFWVVNTRVQSTIIPEYEIPDMLQLSVELDLSANCMGKENCIKLPFCKPSKNVYIKLNVNGEPAMLEFMKNVPYFRSTKYSKGTVFKEYMELKTNDMSAGPTLPAKGVAIKLESDM
jgi:hypothetical protein